MAENIEFNTTNFFSHLMFHPEDSATDADLYKSWTATILLGIFTLGLAHLGVGLYHLFFQNKNVTIKKEEDLGSTDVKAQDQATQILIGNERDESPQAGIPAEKISEPEKRFIEEELPSTHIPAIDAPEKSLPIPKVDHYHPNEVLNRFLRKNPGLKQEQIEVIRAEAKNLTEFTLQSKENQKELGSIDADLQTKAKIKNREPYKPGDLEGKVFSLALKTSHMLNQPGWAPGVYFQREILSKTGVVKPTPVQRLLKADPMIYEFVGSDGKLYRHKVLILKSLGSGSFNQVDLVYHFELNQKVALRQLTPQSLQRWDSVQEWEYELGAHLTLQNEIPGIVRLHYFYKLDLGGNLPHTRCLILEKCDGDLEKFSRKDGEKLPENIRLNAFWQIASTFKALHERNTIHADIKPANILFKQRSDHSIETKVSDFGKVKLTSQEQNPIGDIRYIPADGYLRGYFGNVHQQKYLKVDAWALGLTMYEIKYGAFTAHHAIANEMAKLNHESHFSQQWAEFQTQGDTPYNRQILIQRLNRFYQPHFPFSMSNLPPYMNRHVPIDVFYKDVHNSIIWHCFKPYYDSIFNNICNNLLATHSKEDQVIAGLLDPNSDSRWTTAQAAQELSLYKA